MGIVEKVVQHGFYSIEGNASNQVERRYHDFSAETVFVYLPHCSVAAILHNPDGSIFLDVFGIRLTRGQVFLSVLLFLVGLFLKQPHHWRLPRYRKR
jgi:hypothetical protein